MTNNSLETHVAEFVKGIDEIFERQLKLISELRESFRLVAEAMQKSFDLEELPPLEKVGVNGLYFNRKATNSDVRINKPSEAVSSNLKM